MSHSDRARAPAAPLDTPYVMSCLAAGGAGANR